MARRMRAVKFGARRTFARSAVSAADIDGQARFE
jgi:hypothetical protein